MDGGSSAGGQNRSQCASHPPKGSRGIEALEEETGGGGRDSLTFFEKQPQLGRDVSATKADAFQGHSPDQHRDRVGTMARTVSLSSCYR